jgi:DegV family protein with EDD domain
MKPIILVAETGSDVNPELAAEYQIRIVPMHVTFEDRTTDDGAFPVEEICTYYQNTRKVPKTSGSTPEDFNRILDEIHAEYPDAHILYLAYSAVTTCSYQSCVIASEERDYVTCFDTKHVSIGQGSIVVAMAEALRANPDMTVEEAVELAKDLSERTRMCFLPDNLEFLRAGGRVSNVACLGSRILSLHPCIELLDGRLMATKKYRGKMEKVAAELIEEYTAKHDLERDCLWMVYTIGLSDTVRRSAEEAAEQCGFKRVRWIQAGGVITTHGGPAAFGIAGRAKK